MARCDSLWPLEMKVEEAEFRRFIPLLKPLWDPISGRQYFKSLKIMNYLSTQLGDISPYIQYWAAMCGAFTISEARFAREPKNIDEMFKIMSKTAGFKRNRKIGHLRVLLQEAKNNEWIGDAKEGLEYLRRMADLVRGSTGTQDIQIRCRSLGILLNPASPANVSGHDCAICLETMGEQFKHVANILSVSKHVVSSPDSEQSPVIYVMKGCTKYVFGSQTEREDIKLFKVMQGFIRELSIVYPRYRAVQEAIPQACTYAVTTECGHSFGLFCLDVWIQQRGYQAKCPYCRSKLVSEAARNARKREMLEYVVRALQQ